MTLANVIGFLNLLFLRDLPKLSQGPAEAVECCDNRFCIQTLSRNDAVFSIGHSARTTGLLGLSDESQTVAGCSTAKVFSLDMSDLPGFLSSAGNLDCTRAMPCYGLPRNANVGWMLAPRWGARDVD